MNLQLLHHNLRQRLKLPGDSEETLDLKTTLVYYTAVVLPPVMGMTALCYLWEMPILWRFGWLIIGFYSISLGLFFGLKKHVEAFFYLNQIGMLLITMGTAARLGGILVSGGILYAALAIPVFAFVYPRPRLAIVASMLYILGIVVLALAQPWLTTAPEMLKPNVNLTFTVLNTTWISTYILLVVFKVFDKRAKDERAKNLRLKELDDLKTRLYTNITHEFRTPLTIILGAANPSPLTSANPIPLEGPGGRLDLIRRNANRLLRLVNQMLNLARLESGAMPVHKIQGDVLPILRYFTDSFRSMAERRKVRLHFLCSQPELIMDYDPDKLEDIFTNLLSNAIKFTPLDGDVYISVEISEKAGSTNHFSLKIRDTGIGIPADKLGFIFDRFFQIDPESAHVEEGSGIGLTLVKEYVRLLEGDISVQSTPGKGTEFTLLLPISHDTPREEIALPGSGYFSKNADDDGGFNFEYRQIPENENPELPVLLLVEDNAELRHYLQSVISGHFNVQFARNGQEGIERAIEMVPDIIVSDVMMPVKDGFELCKTLKNNFRTSHIPIVLLTARADADSKLMGLERGADAYLPKPFQPKELLLRLRKLIELREKLKIKYSLNGNWGKKTESPEAAGLDEIFMRDLLQQMEKNYADETFGIEELCTAMNISRVQLHRKLVALTGLSASHFMNRFRLDKATELLRSTRKTISEIAFGVGFHDANYFTKVFTKTFDVSPSEWRQQGEVQKKQ
jgi:signal transduction histidine kinase/DNA-binding response OmpR family regulator